MEGRGVARRLADRFRGWVGRCALCLMPLDGGDIHVCATCRGAMPLSRTGYCSKCGKAMQHDLEPYACAACRLAPPPWERLMTAGRFEGVLREAVLRFKFGYDPAIARLLCACMAEAVDDEFFSGREVLTVAAPLHDARLYQRGFNQSEVLARGVSRLKGFAAAPHALRKVRPTRSQAGLNREERRRNLQGCMTADSLVRGKDVLMVDDVITTGATFTECARALQAAGAVRISALVAASTAWD